MATTSQSPSASSKNVLIPDSTQVFVSGPVEFTQSNQESSNSGRTPTNARLNDIVGYAQADIHKQTSRWFHVKEVTWAATIATGSDITIVTSAEMYSAANPFTAIAQYYRLHRFDPECLITISGNAAMVGQAVLTYLPLGVEDTDYDYRMPALFSHAFIKPGDSTGMSVQGNYVKHSRAEDLTVGHVTGRFKWTVINPLVAPTGVTASTTASIWVRFNNVSLNAYIPPVAITSKEDVRRRMKELTHEELEAIWEEQMAEIAGQEDEILNLPQAETAGAAASRTASNVISDIGRTVGGLGSIAMAGLKLLPLLHAPPEPWKNEWAVTDVPKQVMRMQFSTHQICAADQTIVQMDSIYQLMDPVTLFKLPQLLTPFLWKDTDVVGTELFSQTANLMVLPFFNVLSISYAEYGAFWRGEIKFKFQFVKTAFHKGQVRISVIPQTASSAIATSNYGMTDVVNIADADTHEVTVPWGYATDFLAQRDITTCFKVVVTVLNTLQSISQPTTIAINAWVSAGHDFQMIGGPSHGLTDNHTTGTFWADPTSYTPPTLAEVAGLDEPIATSATTKTDVGPDKQYEETPTEPQPEKQTNFKPVPTNNPEGTVPMLGTTAQEGVGWTTLHQSSWKLGLHRPFLIGSVTLKNVLTTGTAPDIVFKVTRADLTRSLGICGWYTYFSGGVRLHYVAHLSKVTNVSLRVETGVIMGVTAVNNRVSKYFQWINLCDQLQGIIEIPWLQNVPALPVRYNTVPGVIEYDHYIEITMPNLNRTSAYYEPDGIIDFFVSAADDFALHQPTAHWVLPIFAHSVYTPQAAVAEGAEVYGEVDIPKGEEFVDKESGSRLPYKKLLIEDQGPNPKPSTSRDSDEDFEVLKIPKKMTRSVIDTARKQFEEMTMKKKAEVASQECMDDFFNTFDPDSEEDQERLKTFQDSFPHGWDHRMMTAYKKTIMESSDLIHSKEMLRAPPRTLKRSKWSEAADEVEGTLWAKIQPLPPEDQKYNEYLSEELKKLPELPMTPTFRNQRETRMILAHHMVKKRIQSEIGEVAGVEDEKLQDYFLIRTIGGLEEQHHFTQEIGHLAGCDTRFQILGTWDCKSKHSPKLGQTAFVADDKGLRYIHVHSESACVFLPRDYSKDENAHRRQAGACINQAVKNGEYTVVHVPCYPTQDHTFRKVRVKKRKGCISYFTKVGRIMYKTQTRHFQTPNTVWGALAETASLWDTVKSFPGRVIGFPGRVVDKALTNAVKSSTNELMKDFKGRVAMAFGYTTKGQLDTMVAALMTKSLAYTVQILAAKTPTAWMAVMLQILGDIQIALRSYDVVEYLISTISEGVSDIVNLIWLRDEAAEVAGEDDDCYEPCLEEKSWLRSLFDLFVGFGESIFGMTWNLKDTFLKACRTAGLLGVACRGMQAVINAVKALLQWLGFITDPVKNKLDVLRGFSSRKDVMKTFANIPVYLAMNTHNFGGEIHELQVMRGHCYAFSQAATGITDPDIQTKKQQCIDFLRATASMANVSDGVKDFEPVFVMLEGPPGTGKSLMANELARAFSIAFGRGENDFYATQIDAEFFTGYGDQPVMILDDLFQDPEGKNVSFLTQLISAVKTPLAQADIDSKGCQSCARIIIATTNTTMIRDTWLTDPEAIKRRVALTTWDVTEQGKGKRVVFVQANGPKTVRGLVRHIEETLMSTEEIAKYIWDVYLKKWKRHEEIKAKPIIKLEAATGSAAAPTDQERLERKLPKLPEFIPQKRKVDMSFPKMSLDENEEKWYAGNSHTLKRQSVTLFPSVFGLGLDEVKNVDLDLNTLMFTAKDDLVLQKIKQSFHEVHQLELPVVKLLWTTADYYEMSTAYGFPFFGIPETIKDRFKDGDREEDVDTIYFPDCVDDEAIQRACSKLDTPTLQLYFYHLFKQGAHRRTLEKWLPYQGFLHRVLDNLSTKVAKVALFATAGVTLVSVIGTAYLISRTFASPGEASATYHAAARGHKSKLPYAATIHGRPHATRAPTADTAGAEDKEPHIMKSIVRWRVEPTEFNPGITVNGVLMGGGCLLTVAHAVRPGCQHSVLFKNNIGEEIVFPILVTPNTMSQLDPVEGTHLDLCMVYLGAAFPNTKSILNYFIKDESMESMSAGPARVFYKASQENCVMDTKQEYTKRFVNNTRAGKAWKQFTFVGKFAGKQGCCGSLMMTLEKNRDYRLIGLANAVTEDETYFVPVTQEMIMMLKARLTYSPTNILAPPAAGDLDRVAFVASEELRTKANQICVERHFELIPKIEQPVHMEIEHLEQPPVSISLRSQYVLEDKMQVFDNLDYMEPHDLESASKGPALRSLRYSTVPFGEKVGELPIPGHQFVVGRKPVMIDGLMAEFAMTTLQSKLGEQIQTCRILTEEEILNGYEEKHSDRIVTNKGFPTNTAIGHTSRWLGLGQKKADMMVTEDDKKRLNKIAAVSIKNVEQTLKEGGTWQRVVQMNLKDELRNMDKFHKGEIRLFYIEDAIFVYLATKYFGHFMDQYRSLHFDSWHTLGEDPVQIWNQLAEWMPRTLCGDSKNWDLSIQGPLFEMARTVIENFYQTNSGWKYEDGVVRLQLLRQITLTITGYAKHQFLSTGMKSGMYCTTEFNSLMQTLVVLYANHKLLQNSPYTIQRSFEVIKEVRFVTNGDDNMHGSPFFCEETEYVEAIQTAYKDFGLSYTRADKSAGEPEFGPIEQAEYLKRNFVYSRETHQYHPQISHKTISGLLWYHKKTTTTLENFIEALVFTRQARNRRTYRLLQFMMITLFGLEEAKKYTWDWCLERYNATDSDIWCSKQEVRNPKTYCALWQVTRIPDVIVEQVLTRAFPISPAETVHLFRLYQTGRISSWDSDSYGGHNQPFTPSTEELDHLLTQYPQICVGIMADMERHGFLVPPPETADDVARLLVLNYNMRHWILKRPRAPYSDVLCAVFNHEYYNMSLDWQDVCTVLAFYKPILPEQDIMNILYKIGMSFDEAFALIDALPSLEELELGPAEDFAEEYFKPISHGILAYSPPQPILFDVPLHIGALNRSKETLEQYVQELKQMGKLVTTLTRFPPDNYHPPTPEEEAHCMDAILNAHDFSDESS